MNALQDGFLIGQFIHVFVGRFYGYFCGTLLWGIFWWGVFVERVVGAKGKLGQFSGAQGRLREAWPGRNLCEARRGLGARLGQGLGEAKARPKRGPGEHRQGLGEAWARSGRELGEA